MKFGERLKNARLDMDLTQENVANELFITRQTISSWENEKTYPDISSLIKLSNYYHISLDVLLKEDTGMREDLEKKYVSVNMKKVYWKLNLSFFVLLMLFIANILEIVRLGVFYIPILFVFIFIGMSIDNLAEFDTASSLGLKYTWEKYVSGDKGFKYTLIVPIAMFLFGGLCLYLHKGSPWGSFIFGALLIWIHYDGNKK
ncbi:helix-turn-helix domain-containing protein [Leuconostoc suionicum]|uniref:helix-turn-helix domain-containing protein n=1 Tax=Leuconostoc suionicum TaxID=1511761 RepID=UPI00233EC84D|nr:helix-turn-helix domain-containing protein [Leuconostoc suionicum]MDC2806225.1 helix-turn-helix domain-containing protein [Leuconostoc suionicum]MDC2823737.1 helix-turn-helix domain-containing protein [Leuconostoc suionicum]